MSTESGGHCNLFFVLAAGVGAWDGVAAGSEIWSTADGFAGSASVRDLGIWSSFAPKGRIA
jgi:hypothetical protein